MILRLINDTDRISVADPIKLVADPIKLFFSFSLVSLRVYFI